MARPLWEYPTNVLLGFCETFKGNEEIHRFLTENGYAELAALSSAIRGSEEAFDILFKTHPELAALDSAIDNQPQAYLWLKRFNLDFYIIFADACRKKPDALAWLTNNNQELFLRLANIIYDFRENQIFDYHKKNF